MATVTDERSAPTSCGPGWPTRWDPDLTVGEWWERPGRLRLGRADLARGVARPRPAPRAGAGGGRRAARRRGDRAARGARHAPGRPDDPRPRHRRAEAALPPSDRHRRRKGGASCSASRGRARTSPASRPAPSATATSGSSTARRCGPRARRSPTWACSSPGRTPTRPKHQGITYFLFPMDQAGVEVRPLREMTGRALFSEVFFDDAPRPRRRGARRRRPGLGRREHDPLAERAGLGSGGERRRRRGVPGPQGRDARVNAPATSPNDSGRGGAVQPAAFGRGVRRPARARREARPAGRPDDPPAPRRAVHAERAGTHDRSAGESGAGLGSRARPGSQHRRSC